MRNLLWQPVLLAGMSALLCCQHQESTVPPRVPRITPADTGEPPTVTAVNSRSAPAEPVSLTFAWPERFVAGVSEEITYRQQVMEEERVQESSWSYEIRAAPDETGFRLYATDLRRVQGRHLPISVVEMNALQPSLVIGADGELRDVQRVRERRELWRTLTGEGLDREVSAELRSAALREDQFIALDPMRWTAIVSLWNQVTLRQGEVLLIDGWLAPEPSGTLEELLERAHSENSLEQDTSNPEDVEPRASLQLIGRCGCSETTGTDCVELRMLNIAEDRRSSPSATFRVEITLITEPGNLRPHRLLERTSRVSRFESIGAVTATIVERNVEFHYDSRIDIGPTSL